MAAPHSKLTAAIPAKIRFIKIPQKTSGAASRLSLRQKLSWSRRNAASPIRHIHLFSGTCGRIDTEKLTGPRAKILRPRHERVPIWTRLSGDVDCRSGGPMLDIGSQSRVHISTKTFPDDRRLALWREVYGRGIANVDIEPIGDAPFHADVTFNLLPNVSIAAGSRSPAHYRVTSELLKQGRDIIAVSVLRSGHASATQFGQELIGGVGSASVVSATDPSVSTLHTHGSFITLALARPAIAELAPNFTAAFGKPIAEHNTALRLLIKYIDAVLAADELADADLARSA